MIPLQRRGIIDDSPPWEGLGLVFHSWFFITGRYIEKRSIFYFIFFALFRVLPFAHFRVFYFTFKSPLLFNIFSTIPAQELNQV
jgi:hypothetical protein